MEITSEKPGSVRQFAILPKRNAGPHAGSFRKQEVVTNHYQVKLGSFSKIVIFRVKITPAIPADNRALRSELLGRIGPQLRNFISRPVISGFTIYSHEEARSPEESFSCGDHSINVRQVKSYDISANRSLLLSFLNNGLRNLMGKMGYAEIGKSGKYFNCKGERKQIDNLFIYSGFKANFVQLQSGFFLRVDSAKKVVRNENVLEFINTFYKAHDGKDKDEKRGLLKAELYDKIVMATYGRTQYYRIKDVQFKKAEEVLLDGGINMLQYYAQKYQITIRSPGQPLLEVEGKRLRKGQAGPVLLFSELCLMTGIPENFDEQRRKKISESSIKNPPEKVVEIGALMSELKGTEEMKAFSELGLEVKPGLCKFQAKALSVPRLLLGGKNQVDQGKQAFFNLFNKPIYQCKHGICCQILHFRGADLSGLLQTFDSTSRNLGVNMETKTREIQGRGARDIENAIRDLDSKVNVCLIVLPGALKNDYKKIKRSAILGEMVTQVITDFTMRKKNLQSIATKVLLQIIAKRGNTLWVPETAKELAECMLIGFDTASVCKGTFLAATATINSTFSSLHTRSKFFPKPEDKFQAMKELTLACIAAYADRNRSPPREVVVFLNSCTGDQVSIYQDLCFKRLMPELQEIYKRSLSVTAVMVNVKNSERFFLGEGGNSRNVPAGTLINEGMVSQNYDFFLISQQSNRGSTVPNHYRVIFCESKMEEGLLQELIFSQCFNYVNWTGSIKVPAVLQYAKKCAKFVSEVMEQEEVPESIRGKPYFV